MASSPTEISVFPLVMPVIRTRAVSGADLLLSTASKTVPDFSLMVNGHPFRLFYGVDCITLSKPC